MSETLSAVGFLFPPWSFLPIGIGEHPASDSLAFDGLVSLHSLSYLWVSGRRRLQLTLPFSDFFSLLSLSYLGGIGEVTPIGISVGDACEFSSVVALYVLPGNASGVTLTSSLALILALVNA